MERFGGGGEGLTEAWRALPGTRREAQTLGLRHFFTGKPCKRGHVARRTVCDKRCTECERERSEARDHTWTEQRRAQRLQRPTHLPAQRARYYRNLEQTRAVARAHAALRAARKLNAEGSYTPEDIAGIRQRQRDRCALCRVKLGGGGEVDHIVAITKGGSNWPRNLQLTCDPCNCRKQARDQIDFMRTMGRLL